MGLRATATIKPVKVREYRPDWKCDVLRVVGYRVHCSCDWKSATHPTIESARAANENHRLECEAPAEVSRAEKV